MPDHAAGRSWADEVGRVQRGGEVMHGAQRTREG
jgi:hypothetical protein